ncbi:Lipoprotein LpqB beta-propeller domain-containing protein [Micromonospora citrea]|uniref:Lipoprotein LpqB beta-propeller domain-containing protein n=1 Tax=Micromonospora citrea TaxID=47855 RepID=A0A1C6UIW1_9ACTN|nr:LpqB family beta-propeller domain-containing protein [Micromonospora citrea]SCL54025.1 Lipoprotein LpqB beta-propeller domain-containing protein [Micromonospora citrea]
MRRRLLAAVLGGALLLGGAAGCGIPAGTEVRVEGSGPAAESGSTSGVRGEPPNRSASGSDPEQFVTHFLSAAAGEPDRAYQRVRQFIAKEDVGRLQEKQGSEVALTVVRLTEDPVIVNDPDKTRVTINVQQIGLLRADGTLAPPETSTTSYSFELRSPPGQEGRADAGLFVANPPNALLLSVEALETYYQSRTIYFWNSDRSQLVPDRRYLPLAVPDERRVSEVVKWLTAGPSDWLRTGASKLPDGTRLINNATRTDGRWEVDLEMPDEKVRLEQFATQLAWSLNDLDGPLEIKIRTQSRKDIPDLEAHRRSHPAYRLGDGFQRFCVYEGAVHPLADAGGPVATVPVVPEANRNVVTAGLSRADDQILAALVVTDGDRQRLSVGTGLDPVAVFTRGARTFGAVGRPVWLRSTGRGEPAGLVVADGALYRFDARAQLTAVPLGVPGRVTAVAASLDGHRIAVIAGGALYVAALSADEGGVTLGPPRRLPTRLTGLSAVDWYGEDRLLLAGEAGRPAVYEVSVDGAWGSRLEDKIGARVTHLAAYPANPTLRSGAAMYEANGVAYRSGPFERIQPEQVQVSPPSTGARAGNPTAPFFLY